MGFAQVQAHLTLTAYAGIMHLLLHVIGAQADSSYTAYFPIGVFFVVLGFMLFLFIQRVLGPLLTPAGAASEGSCCAAAVPTEVARRLLGGILPRPEEGSRRAAWQRCAGGGPCLNECLASHLG